MSRPRRVARRPPACPWPPSWVAGVAIVSLLVLGAAPGWPTPAGAPRGPGPEEADGSCPATGIARLAEGWPALLDRARRAERSDRPRCVFLGRAGGGAFDVERDPRCHRLGLPPGVPDGEPAAVPDNPEAAALLAAHAWRCGAAELAWAAARFAVRGDPEVTLGWSVLGGVLVARFAPRHARAAYETALALEPEETRALWGLASVTAERAGRRAALQRYLVAAEARGEPRERREAARESIALLDALGDREVWRLETAELPASLSLRALASRPGRVSGYTLDVPAARRGRVRMLLDSGASGLHLAPRASRKLAVQSLATAVLHGGGGSGRHEVDRALVPTLDLGPLVFLDALGTTSPGSLHSQGAFQALVGLDVFRGMVVTFDPGRRTLSLERGAARASGDDDPRAAEPFDVGDGWQPLLTVHGQLLTPVLASGAGGSFHTLALIDTGAAQTIAGGSVAGRAGPTRASPEAGVAAYGGRMEALGRLSALTVRLGPSERTLRDVSVVDLSIRERLGGVRVGLLLGWDFLGADALEFDLSRGRFRMSPRERSRAR